MARLHRLWLVTLTVPDPVLGPWAKAFPPRSWGTPVSAVHGLRSRLSEYLTPVLAVDTEALGENERTMTAWSREHGVLLAPHGKTSMAPALWQRQLADGAWGITLATPWQVEVGVAAGLTRIMLANDLADVAAASRISAHVARGVRIVSWVDSLEAVRIIAAHTGPVPIEILVDLGTEGGRTGARGVDDAERIARAVAAEPGLRFAGVAGYEAPIGTTAEDQGAVDAFLADLAELHRRTAGLVDGRPIVTAGGSEWPDRVVAILGDIADADVIVRAGASQLHDDGRYRASTPFGRRTPGRLRSAMHVYSRVLSRPEPGLAILDAGRRDVSYDGPLPEPQLIVGRGAFTGRVTAVNDQHAFLRFDGDGPRVGDVVRLGVSHPCTVLDKWRVVPLIDDPDAPDPLVIGAFATLF